MLRVSDGKWEVAYVLRSIAIEGDPFGLIGLSLHQDDPDASLLIENVIKKTYGSHDYYDIYVDNLSVNGTFRYNEEAYAKWTDVNGNEQTITVFLQASPSTPEIQTAGSYYEAGSIVSLYDTTGQDFVARVSNIGLGSVDDILILDGGSGYSVGDLLSVDNTGTGGANLKVSVSAVDSGVITKLNIINPGLAYSELPIVTGAHGGKFLPISSSIGRVSEVTTSDLGHDHPVQLVETIARTRGVITDPIGTFVSGETVSLLSECLLSENLFTILTEDGYRMMVENQSSRNTDATVFKVIDNMVELDGQITRRGIELEDGSGIILNEEDHVGFEFLDDDFEFLTDESGAILFDEIGNPIAIEFMDFAVSAILNENSSAELNRRTIVGNISGATCRIIDMHPMSVLYEMGTVSVTNRNFTNLDGKVSEATKRIQDSKFYQDFSYVIKSAQSTETYKNIVQRLIHPAGLAMFGEVSTNTYVKIGLRVIEQFDSIINIETLIQIGFVPADTQTQLTQQFIFFEPRNSYSGLDRWKFDYVGSSTDSPYQSNTMIGNFSDRTFENIYIYDDNENVIGYVPTHTYYERGSEVRVNGTLI
jgi:hypothetical protein